jgi:hypothetical protein
MDVFEIICAHKDENGIISHYGVKGYGIQSIEIIDNLIREETCAFVAYDGEDKKDLYTKSSKDGSIFLTTDPIGTDMDTLNFLPPLDKPLVRQLLEPAR